MGIISETVASHNAKALLEVLHDGMDTDNEDICLFLKEHILHLYLDEVGEAYEIPNMSVVNFYRSIG